MDGNITWHGKPRRKQAQIGISYEAFPPRDPGRVLEMSGNGHPRGMVIAAICSTEPGLQAFWLLLMLSMKKTVRGRVHPNGFKVLKTAPLHYSKSFVRLILSLSCNFLKKAGCLIHFGGFHSGKNDCSGIQATIHGQSHYE